MDRSNFPAEGDVHHTLRSPQSTSSNAQLSSGGVALATNERALAVRTRVMLCLRVAVDDLQVLERELRTDLCSSTNQARGTDAASSHPRCGDALLVESRRLWNIIDAMSTSAEEANIALLSRQPKQAPALQCPIHGRTVARSSKVCTLGMRSHPVRCRAIIYPHSLTHVGVAH